MKRSKVAAVVLSVVVGGTLLTGYNSFNNEKPTKKESHAVIKHQDRVITDEEKGYIKLVLDKNYKSLQELTKKKLNEIQTNYNNIALAFINFQEAEKLRKENNPYYVNGLKIKYSNVLKIINNVKFIPNELGKQINEMKQISNERNNYYTQIQNDQMKKSLAHLKSIKMKPIIAGDLVSNEVPQIGDTEDQVLNSTWGTPEDKTETKDAYGTSAMWFYDGMKSIFFVDGKVNSISQ